MKSFRLSIVLILMSFSLTAHAFKIGEFKVVFHADPVHEDITKAALSQLQTTLPNGREIVFSSEAVAALQIANRNTDNNHWDDPALHFDEEGFTESIAILKQNKITIIEHLASSNKNSDAQKARELLGMSLHTIQDFFAHSNWVDRKKETDPLLPTPKPWDEYDYQLATRDFSAATCNQGELIPGAPLTTGWYDLSMMNPVNLDLGWDTNSWFLWRRIHSPLAQQWPVNKCVHGGDNGAGLNKDYSGRDKFLEAKQYATEASNLFVNEIIEELKVKNDYQAICRLMDQEDSANCKYLENLGTASVVSYSSPITTIDKILLGIENALSYIKSVLWVIFNSWGEPVAFAEKSNQNYQFPMETILPDSGSYTAKATFYDANSNAIGGSSVTFDVMPSITAFPKILITDTLDASSGNPVPIIDSITTTRFPIVTGLLTKPLDQRIGHKQTINLYDNDKLVENYVSSNDKVEWGWKPNKPLSLGVHSFRASISEMGLEGEKTAPWIVEIKDDLSEAKSGTFIVNANASAGTTFKVPKDTSTCNFTATTSQWGLAASGQDTTLEGNTAWVSSTYVGHPIIGGALIAKPITGPAITIGASKTLNNLTPNTQWTFMANDSPAGYADNIGSATVSYDCSSISSAIDIPATAFVRGVNVALSANGYGADAVMNAPPYGPADNSAEWDINVPTAGRYELFAVYASGESRPVSISFNGTVASTNALSASTGGYFPANRQTLSQGFVQLSAGANIMRVFETGANVFPHIKGFSLVPAPLPLLNPSWSLTFDQANITSAGGSAIGSPAYILGKDNKPAVSLSGGSKIRIPNREALKVGNAGATFDIWVKPSVTNSSFAVIGKSHDRTGGVLFLSGSPSGIMNGYWGSFDGTWACTTGIAKSAVFETLTPIPAGNWIRLTGVIDPNDGFRVYLDKKLSSWCKGIRPSTATINIQDMYIGGFSDSWWPFYGLVQELNVYNSALTDSQVQALQ